MTALSPTIAYTMRESVVMLPKMNPTRSKFKNHTSPRLSPHTIKSTSAMVLAVFMRNL